MMDAETYPAAFLLVGSFKLEFKNAFSELPRTDFPWVRGSTAITLKKDVIDFSIPVLAKTALSAGVGINRHVSTPRANVDMVKGLIGDDLLNALNIDK